MHKTTRYGHVISLTIYQSKCDRDGQGTSLTNNQCKSDIDGHCISLTNDQCKCAEIDKAYHKPIIKVNVTEMDNAYL